MVTDFVSFEDQFASLVLHARYAEFLEIRDMLKSYTVLTPVQIVIRDNIIAEIDCICRYFRKY